MTQGHGIGSILGNPSAFADGCAAFGLTETGCTDDGTVLGITFDKIGAASAEAVFAVIFIEAADGDTVDGAGSDFCMGTDSDGVLRLYGSTLADSNTILLFDRAAFPDGDTLFASSEILLL